MFDLICFEGGAEGGGRKGEKGGGKDGEWGKVKSGKGGEMEKSTNTPPPFFLSLPPSLSPSRPSILPPLSLLSPYIKKKNSVSHIAIFNEKGARRGKENLKITFLGGGTMFCPGGRGEEGKDMKPW